MFALIAPAILTLLVSCRTAAAAPSPVFVGCISTYTPGAFVSDFTQTSAYNCAVYCNNRLDGPYTYSGYVPQYQTGSTTVQLCACSNEAPDAQDYAVSPESDGSAVCADNQANVMATDSSYTFNTCVNTNALWPPADAFPEDAYRAGLLDTPEECLATCKQYPVAAIQPDTIKNQYNCFCGSDTSFTYTSTGACQEYQYFTYQHTANTAVSSQFAKRQLKERMLRLQGDKHALCPGGLTACKVSGAEDSFECIDTSSELESCGGCAHGAFNANQTSFGFDCTRLEGVAAGAVTCSRGKCESYKCLPEFRLAANGTCIAA